jgi:thiamine-phosphate pyrophosphorylase
LTDVVDTLVGAGARAIVLREKDLPHGDRAALATELRPIVHGVGGMLVVASDPTIDADGLHLAAADPFPQNRPRVVGRSCHDLDEVLAAEDEGCDYVTLSPIFDSISTPGHRPAGRNGLTLLRSVCGHVSLPVFALGGIADWRAAATCIRQGAYGVAALGAVMSDPGSDRTRELLSHTSTYQQEMTL